MFLEASLQKKSGLQSLWPFKRSAYAQIEFANQFAQTFADVENEVFDVIQATQSSLNDIDKLKRALHKISNVVQREKHFTNVKTADVLAELWTQLGGNGGKLIRAAENLRVLQHLEDYHQYARQQIYIANYALETLSAKMKNLRTRVASPDHTRGRVPPEILLGRIGEGIETMKVTLERAKAEEKAAQSEFIHEKTLYEIRESLVY